MAELTFREVLRRTLEDVEDDAPECAHEMARVLGDRRVVIEVSDSVVELAVLGERVRTMYPRGSAGILLRTDETVLVDVVAGARDLLTAIEVGEVTLVAGVEDLLALDDALRWLVAGAVRTRSVAMTWQRYRSAVERRNRVETWQQTA